MEGWDHKVSATKNEIQEAWDSKLKETRDEIRGELRDEFSRRYEHDKETMAVSPH